MLSWFKKKKKSVDDEINSNFEFCLSHGLLREEHRGAYHKQYLRRVKNIRIEGEDLFDHNFLFYRDIGIFSADSYNKTKNLFFQLPEDVQSKYLS